LKLFVNFCFQSLLKSTTDCCQTERQIQQDAWVSARIPRVSQQCLYENCPQIIEKEQRPSNNSPNLNAIEIRCPGSDTWNYFETSSSEA